MAAPTLNAVLGRADSAQPTMCLEYLQFARKVFSPDDERWFTLSGMLGLYGQAQQLIRSDVVCLPLFDLVSAWWNANRDQAALSEMRPDAALKQLFTDESLVAYVTEIVNGLASVTRDESAYALFIDSPEHWYSMIGETFESEMPEEDLEDYAFYLSNFLGQLSDTALSGMILQQNISVDGELGDALEPLVNITNHMEWDRVLCGNACPESSDGFTCFNKGMLAAEDWQTAASQSGRFVISVIPETLTAETVVNALQLMRS